MKPHTTTLQWSILLKLKSFYVFYPLKMLEVGISGSFENAAYSYSALRQIFNAIEEMVENVVIKFSKDVVRAQVIDSMHVCLCDIELKTSLFSHYRCDRDVIVTLNLKIFNTILKNCSVSSSDSSFMISCKEMVQTQRSSQKENETAEEGKKEILCSATKLLVTNEVNSSTQKFTVDLLESENPQFMMPEADWKSQIDLHKDGFRLLKNLGNLFGTKVTFKVREDEFTLCQSGDGTKSDLVLKGDDETKPYQITCEEPCSIEINKTYLDLVSKLFGLSDSLKICLSNDAPIFFELSLNKNGFVHFFIAPQA